MKTPRHVIPAALLALLALGAFVPSTRATAPGDTLIDFINIRRDPDGTEMRPFEYAWGDWDKHVNPKRNLGTVLKANTGKGGMGENNTGVDFAGCAAIQLVYVIGAGDKSNGVSFYLEDKDGTGHAWNISFEGKPRGREVRQNMELAKPDYVQNAGKTPGLNPKKITVWQLRGDNNDPPVELLLLKLVRSQ